MKYYEILYIVHPALEGGHLHDIVNSVNDLIKNNKGELEGHDNWGKKKLAYPIEKEKYGTYIFFQYKIKDIKNIIELNSEFQHNPNVLRHLTIEIDEKDILEKKEKEIIETKKKIDKDISPKINKKEDEKIDNVTEEKKTEPTKSEKEE